MLRPAEDVWPKNLGKLQRKCKYYTAHCGDLLKKPVTGTSEGRKSRHEVESVGFEVARAAPANRAAVPEEILVRLEHHLTPPQIVQLACVVEFWKMYNTIHDALRIPIEAHLEHDTDFPHN